MDVPICIYCSQYIQKNLFIDGNKNFFHPRCFQQFFLNNF